MILANVLKWQYQNTFPRGYFEVIAAGVPCNEYSPAKTIGQRRLDYADRLVEKTLEIIQFFNPPVWWIENPRLGLLKDREVIRGIPFILDGPTCLSKFVEFGHLRANFFNTNFAFFSRCPG